MAKRSPLRSLSPPYRALSGAQWVASLPADVDEPDGAHPCRQSRLALFENGDPLGPAHSSHADIEALGGGRYSHWQDGLRFSTRDGSDPNSNGRSYTFSLSRRAPGIIVMGSCHVHRAAAALEENHAILPLLPTFTSINNTREHRQVLDRCLNERKGPGELAALCAMPVERPLTERQALVAHADAIILDIGAPLTFEFDQWQLNAGALFAHLVEPARTTNEQLWHLAARWYKQGLLQQREDIRLECVTAILRAAPSAPSWARSVLLRTKARRQSISELSDDVRWIQSAVGKPLILASMPIRFTQRGVPISYTPNFFAAITRLGEDLSVPVIHLHNVLQSMGLSRSIQLDRQHMSEDGAQAYADALLKVIRAHGLTRRHPTRIAAAQKV